MGAKDWMLAYAGGEIRPILQSAPAPDRPATRALVRALSLSPMSGIAEDIGPRLDFEDPYWSGQRPLAGEGGSYPFPFHPLELGEAALRALFGFNYEGVIHHDDPDLERITLAGFAIQPTLGS